MSFQSVLVTGGSGFFGRGFVRHALAMNVPRVVVFSRDEAKHAAMRAEFGHEPRLRYFVGDVRDLPRLTRAMDGCDLVVHAAALKRVEVGEIDPEEVVKTNIYGTHNVIEAARAASLHGPYGLVANRRRVVFLSSDKACEPANLYGATKLCAEKLILAANNGSGHNGPMFSCTRYGNVSGSTGSVIPTWRQIMRAGGTVRMTDPDATRFWMTLQEAVDLVWDTAKTMIGGELAIPDLPAYRLGDLLTAMTEIDHRYTLSITGLGQGEKAHESMRPGQTSADARRMSITELEEALRHV